MRKPNKSIIMTIFLGLMLFSILSSIRLVNFNYIANNEIISLMEEDGLRPSGFWVLNETEIDGEGDWSNFNDSINGNLAGSGTFSDPYIIENVTFKSDGLGLVDIGLSISNTNKYFIIQNCTFINLDLGLRLNSVGNGTIKNNIFENCSQVGIEIPEIASVSTHCSNLTIWNNEIINSLLSIRLSGKYINVSENRLYYDPNEAPYYYGGIKLHGTLNYRKSLIIDSLNTLNGKNIYYYANQTGLDSGDFTNPGQIILVNCSQSTITGFTFLNSTYPIALYRSNHNIISNNNFINATQSLIIEGSSKNNTVLSNDLSNTAINGIYLDYCNQTKIVDNTITGGIHGIYSDRSAPGQVNHIYLNTINGPVFGILIENGEGFNITNNSITNCSGAGIDLTQYSSNCQIINNSIIHDGSSVSNVGIALYNTDDTVISGNNVSLYAYGISLSSSDNNNINLNNITKNNLYGIRVILDSDSTTITLNNITFHDDYNIYISESDGCTIEQNFLSETNGTGIHIINSDNCDVLDNEIYNNDLYGVYLDQSANCKINYNTLANNEVCIGVHQNSCPNLQAIGNTCDGNAYTYTPLDPPGGNGSTPFPIEIIIGIVVIVGIVGVITIYMLRRRRS
ncbi:MAG: right-handed parallel beta-helix repeat-containing protein [Promethearchaeota archaeon]